MTRAPCTGAADTAASFGGNASGEQTKRGVARAFTAGSQAQMC